MGEPGSERGCYRMGRGWKGYDAIRPRLLPVSRTGGSLVEVCWKSPRCTSTTRPAGEPPAPSAAGLQAASCPSAGTWLLGPGCRLVTTRNATLRIASSEPTPRPCRGSHLNYTRLHRDVKRVPYFGTSLLSRLTKLTEVLFYPLLWTMW